MAIIKSDCGTASGLFLDQCLARQIITLNIKKRELSKMVDILNTFQPKMTKILNEFCLVSLPALILTYSPNSDCSKN